MGLKTAKKAPGPLDIDDPADLRNQQLNALARPRHEFRGGADVWVFVTDTMSPMWEPIRWRPPSLAVAVIAVDNATKSGVSWATLRAIISRIQRIDADTSDEEARTILGRLILSGQIAVIWKNNRLAAGKADPAVLAQLNARFRTAVNFEKLSGWEGGQYLRGYVPIRSDVVVDNSGLTIATGFDLGQTSATELAAVGLTPETERKLAPFVGKSFKKYTRTELVDYLNSLRAPTPQIAKGQADLLDKASHGKHLGYAMSAWNGARAKDVPGFTTLPTPWQTVVLSRFFHAGTISRQTKYASFWSRATTGQWVLAIAALRTADPTYSGRLSEEADYLATNVPPAVIKPPAPKPKAK